MRKVKGLNLRAVLLCPVALFFRQTGSYESTDLSSSVSLQNLTTIVCDKNQTARHTEKTKPGFGFNMFL